MVNTFAATFNAGVANSIQYAGVGNFGSSIYFCYNGTDFGVRTSTNGLEHVVTLTITAAENTTATGTITLNSVAYNVSLTNAGGDLSFTAHECEVGDSFGSLWNVEHIDDKIVFESIGVGPRNGTYTYSSTGASTGTFATTKTGVATTTTDVTTANWNGPSRMITQVDPTKRNMYEIEYSWYGTGSFLFRIYNPTSGQYELVHQIDFANKDTVPSLTQPNMFVQFGVESQGSTTAMTMTVPGQYGALLGEIRFNLPIYGIDTQKIISASTETVLMVIKNRNTVNGFANHSESLIERISAVTDGNRPVKFKIISNPTTLSANSTTDYTDYNFVDENNSISLFDTVADTYTGGVILDTFFVGKNGLIYLDLKGREIELFESEVLVITAESTATNTVDLSITLLEDL
jgi:hypothetical protein